MLALLSTICTISAVATEETVLRIEDADQRLQGGDAVQRYLNAGHRWRDVAAAAPSGSEHAARAWGESAAECDAGVAALGRVRSSAPPGGTAEYSVPELQLLHCAGAAMYYLKNYAHSRERFTRLRAGTERTDLRFEAGKWIALSHQAEQRTGLAALAFRRAAADLAGSNARDVDANVLRAGLRSLEPPFRFIMAQVMSQTASDNDAVALEQAARLWNELETSGLLRQSGLRHLDYSRQHGGGRRRWSQYLVCLQRCVAAFALVEATGHSGWCQNQHDVVWERLAESGSGWQRRAQIAPAFAPALRAVSSSPFATDGRGGRGTGWLDPHHPILLPCAALQSHANVIIAEYRHWRSVGRANVKSMFDFSPDHADQNLVGSAHGSWEILYLRRPQDRGRWSYDACKYVLPTICSILQELPLVAGRLQQNSSALQAACHVSRGRPGWCPPAGTPSFFDMPGPVALYKMRNGTQLTTHVGTTNMRLKCQLALELPDTDANSAATGAYLEVGGERRPWTTVGQVLSFDDSYTHSAGNQHPTSDRVILDVSFWHPDLTDAVVTDRGQSNVHEDF